MSTRLHSKFLCCFVKTFINSWLSLTCFIRKFNNCENLVLNGFTWKCVILMDILHKKSVILSTRTLVSWCFCPTWSFINCQVSRPTEKAPLQKPRCKCQHYEWSRTEFKYIEKNKTFIPDFQALSWSVWSKRLSRSLPIFLIA